LPISWLNGFGIRDFAHAPTTIAVGGLSLMHAMRFVKSGHVCSSTSRGSHP
jgi:hypothetical protein